MSRRIVLVFSFVFCCQNPNNNKNGFLQMLTHIAITYWIIYIREIFESQNHITTIISAWTLSALGWETRLAWPWLRPSSTMGASCGTTRAVEQSVSRCLTQQHDCGKKEFTEELHEFQGSWNAERFGRSCQATGTTRSNSCTGTPRRSDHEERLPSRGRSNATALAKECQRVARAREKNGHTPAAS